MSFARIMTGENGKSKVVDVPSNYKHLTDEQLAARALAAKQATRVKPVSQYGALTPKSKVDQPHPPRPEETEPEEDGETTVEQNAEGGKVQKGGKKKGAKEKDGADLPADEGDEDTDDTQEEAENGEGETG